ncbi:hypothetical protein [Methylocella sp.]|uniref:hypothetical protein n=1 Tax=Methylocella sp. TaxID=1978226 RepID=UPI003784ABAC
MFNLMMVGLLLGMALGRFFRVYVLIPGCALAVVLAMSGPQAFDSSILSALIEVAVAVAALQAGYVAALVFAQVPLALPRLRRLSAPQA